MVDAPLLPGIRLGPYEVIELLGAGGMGEVYKARDTRLDRVVAVKVLAQSGDDAEGRRARFALEARAISSLDHPNICALYDIGEANGLHFIVIQYLEGQTLADRLKSGAMPFGQVLRFGAEIADALDKAHRAGVVHRDLKPANIMLTRSGAKLLDFGLAKLREPFGPLGMSSLTRLGDSHQTAEGTILGTVPYMAPEQVEGREADPRSDIFALGAVLYEAAVGKRPFDGATPAAIIGAILKDDPPTLTSHRPLVPPGLDQLVLACLAKDPEDRWQSTADVKRQLSWMATQRSDSGITLPVSPRARWTHLSWRIATLVLATALVAVFPVAWREWRASTPEAQGVRFTIVPPDRTTFAADVASVPSTQLAVSPDGRSIAFVAAVPGERPALWIRALDSATPQLLAGTEDASYPFWSPDSRSLGFFTQSKMKRVDLAGGAPQTLCDVDTDARGGTWNRDGVIVFARGTSAGLSQVSGTGGTARSLLSLREGENSYRWPVFLPDGRHFLFHIRGGKGRGVYLGSLVSTDVTLVLDDVPYSAVYSPPGYLLTMREGDLLAYPFDEKQLRVVGEPVRVADRVGGSTTLRASFSSAADVLAYAGPLRTPSRLTWVDRAGKPVGIPTEVADYVNFRISPDGRRVAVTRVDEKSSTTDLWLLDVERNMQTRFTSHPATDTSPVWSLDGTRIAFRSDRAGGNFPFERSSAADTPEQLLARVETQFLTDWSPDGTRLAFHGNTGVSFHVGVVQLAGGAPAQFVGQTTSTEIDGRFSPDGRWIAYSSDDSGQMEVYVAPFPRSGGRLVSMGGGSEPHWRRDGRELFYLAADRKIMSVAVDSSGVFGVPKPLFQTAALFPGSIYHMNFDVNGDGTRFLVSTPVEGAGLSPITVVVNWLRLKPS